MPINWSCRTMVLALLILGSIVPRSVRAAGPTIELRQSKGELKIADPGARMAVRIGGSPLQILVTGANAQPLIDARVGMGAVSFDLDRAALERELPRQQFRTIAQGPVMVHVLRLLRGATTGSGATLVAATDDPLGRVARIVVRFAAQGTVEIVARLADNRAVVAVNLAVPSGTDEHFFGMGEQFGGVDQRGRRVGVLVQDGMTTIRSAGGYAPAPFFMSTRGYGFYLAGNRPSKFALDAAPETTLWQITVQAPFLDGYVLDGPLPADILARYVDLTGHPPMPPPWTVGVWKTALGGQARILAEARRLRSAHIPVSVIWTYDAVDEASKLGWPYPNFARIPPGPYPDLPGFTAALHAEGYKVLGYLAPEFTRSRSSFAYNVEHGFFVRGKGGHIYLIDLTNPAALAWWQNAERRILTTLGFDGWLLDLGDRLPPDAQFFNGQGAEDMANRYPILLAQAAATVVRQVKPDALFVMRSSFSGAQSLQPAVWAGDQRANWSASQGLPAAISAGLSWGLSGAPFWGSDIGGYLDGGLPQAQREELWMRWLEFGAFSPIMRDQLGNMDYGAIYLWSNARTEAAFRFYAQLRQSLFPYLYAAARTAHLTGMPIMRDLFLAYPHDPHIYGLNSEYLLGPDLLIAPVITPGATSEQIYLPAGTWIDYWTGAQRNGGRMVTAAAPIDRIPIFVRGGALLPSLASSSDTLAPSGDSGVRQAGSDLMLRVYPGDTNEQITLADGTLLATERNAQTIRILINGPARRYSLSISLDHAPHAVDLNGSALVGGPTNGWNYDAEAQSLQVEPGVSQGSMSVTVTR